MNKSLAWLGSIAGALSAGLLMVGLPSWSGIGKFNGCTSTGTVSTSRTLQWGGDDSVEIRVPGSVHFKVGPQWRAVVEGPMELVDQVRIRNGRIEFDRSQISFCNADLNIELTGPAVRQWTLASSGDLVLELLNQADLDMALTGSGSITASGKLERTRAKLSGSGNLKFDGGIQRDVEININGSGSVIASGAAERVRVSIPGSGHARLGALAIRDATVVINGSGNVELAAEENVSVRINGVGNVKLLKKPKSVQSQIHGVGHIIGAS